MAITHYVLPDGWRLLARRREQGANSLRVELILHHPGHGRVCGLTPARWNPGARLLYLRSDDDHAAIAQHGVDDVDAVLQVIADDLGFPAVEWTDEERARDTPPPEKGRDVA